jgi:carbamoyl-phosphate synthase/aspartate carbamoyltransferase/dihydroorotase
LTEKQSATPPPGIAGLETSLPLMLGAVKAGRLSLERLIALMATNPRHIYNLPEQPNTYIEVDPTVEYVLSNAQLHTKCGWSPFAEETRTLTGHIKRVVLRGRVVYEATHPQEKGKVLAQPGQGQVVEAEA